MPDSQQHFPVRLTQAQRKVVAEVAPELANRLILDERNQRTILFTLVELKAIKAKAGAAVGMADSGMVRNSLRHVTDLTAQALEHFQGIGAIPVAERLYQFKITLRKIAPPIWRRIQVKNCTLDKLHEHIQTSMGWTNSHLHDFKIEGKNYGDPLLLDENFEEFDYADSTTTKLSDIFPKTGLRFRFEYKYDFGDGWQHEVVFEGCLRAERGGRYPVCLEGAMACPPEDVGGVPGYEEYLEAMADPEHEGHEELLGWRGSFEPEAFDTVKATKKMWRGLPDWRSERWL
jgi:Plasmid pRiA4b ORF-3-like protein